jgi:cysteine sulfinate desulfinase/cysteine desulfurase-like protein
MGVTPEAARGALRLSFGMLSEDRHGLAAADAVVRCAAKLRRASAVV